MRSASAKLRASRAARRASISCVDLLDRHRRLLVLGAAQRQHAEDAVEAIERRAHRRGVGRAQLAGVDRGVERAHQVEHDAERRGGVEVGGDVLREGGGGLVELARHGRVRIAAPAACSSRARKSVSRFSASSACAIAAHENFSCLR